MKMSIRRRLFLSYIALILVVLSYAGVTSTIRTLRIRLETDRYSILKLRNSWSQIPISLNNIVINWRDGESFEKFLTQRDIFEQDLLLAKKNFAQRKLYPSELSEHLDNMHEVWKMVNNHLNNVIYHTERPEFSQVTKIVEDRPGLQRLNHLWVELFYSGNPEKQRLAYLIENLVSSIEFFPIYEGTVHHMFDVTLELTDSFHAKIIRFQQGANIIFFALFMLAAFLLSSRFAFSLSRPIVRVADRLSRFMGRSLDGRPFRGNDEVRVLARTAEHMIRHYTRLSIRAEQLAKGEIDGNELISRSNGVVDRALDDIATYFTELTETSEWIRQGRYGSRVKEKSSKDVLAHNFNVMSSMIYEKISTLRSMFEGVNEGVLVVNDTGEVLESNTQANELFMKLCSSPHKEQNWEDCIPLQIKDFIPAALKGDEKIGQHITLSGERGHKIPIKITVQKLPATRESGSKVMFLISNESWRARAKRERERLKAHAAMAELKALRAQINPHFFFNTLNTISYLIETKPDDAVGTVEVLADLFRYTMAATKRERVTLAEEIEQVKRFLEIEKLRYGDRLSDNYLIGPDLENTPIPPMLLQPIVENAVRYGKDDEGRVNLEISVSHEDEYVIIEIRDFGTSELEIENIQINSGTGIKNINQRLKTLYQQNLYFTQNVPRGLVVGMKIPWRPV